MNNKIKAIIFIVVIIFSLSGCTNYKKDNDLNSTRQNENSNVENTQNNNNNDIIRQTVVTKNTSRIMGTDAESISIATSHMIWPATDDNNRPNMIIVAPMESWQIQLVAVDLIHHPSDGPLLITSKDEISDGIMSEIERLKPVGGEDGTKIITIGLGAEATKQLTDNNYKVHEINAENFNQIALEIDSYYESVSGELPQSVIVGSSDALEYSLPAANWIAHMPEPLLYVTKTDIPNETITALEKRNGKANIYMLGPDSIISKDVENELEKYGDVTRISGKTPYANAIEFARFKDNKTGFGWGITMPGHGLLIASKENINDSIASGAFSHRGKHAPLLLTENKSIPDELKDYLSELQPTFENDPTEGPYTHIYLVGTGEWITQEQQGNLDNLIEISPGEGDTGNKMIH